MSMRSARTLLLPGALALLASCGGSSSNNVGTNLPSGFYISVTGMAYSPLQLEVPPGGTVTVLNNDAMPHTVTSEATSGAFTPGAVATVQFDTGNVAGGTKASFVVPAGAPEGTIIPYYCKVHTSTMATPNGTIKVNSGAQPAPAPGGGMGGGGGY
jgi:plastocyanin